MAHAHPHAPHSPKDAALGAPRRLMWASVLTCSVMVIEAVGGAMADALALWADAGHMLTDLLALILAWTAALMASRPADRRRTFGYGRLEVLSALLSGLALLAVAGVILWQACQRFVHPVPVHIPTVLKVASVGLVANVLGLKILGHHHHNLNVRAAFLHVLADTLSSLAVLVGGIAMAMTGVMRIDALLSGVIALIIAYSTVRLLREIVDILLESVPRGLDAGAIEAAMLQVDGVLSVHDLHIWSITREQRALSAHVVVTDLQRTGPGTLQALAETLRARFHIPHTTLQLELPSTAACGCDAIAGADGALPSAP